MVPYELSGSMEKVLQRDKIHAELLLDNKLFVFNDFSTRYKSNQICKLFLHVSLKNILTHLCHFVVGVYEFILRVVSKATIVAKLLHDQALCGDVTRLRSGRRQASAQR